MNVEGSVSWQGWAQDSPAGTVVQNPAHGVGTLGIEKMRSIGVSRVCCRHHGHRWTPRLSPEGIEPKSGLYARLQPLLLGCCGQAIPARGTVQKGECTPESIRRVGLAPPVPSWAVLVLWHHGPGPGECLLGYALPLRPAKL